MLTVLSEYPRPVTGGGAGGVPSGLSTVTSQNTPKSSIHVAPSTSGRRYRRYVPGMSGAWIVNWNQATWPGPTYGAGCTAMRLYRGQPVLGEPSAPSPPSGEA